MTSKDSKSKPCPICGGQHNLKYDTYIKSMLKEHPLPDNSQLDTREPCVCCGSTQPCTCTYPPLYETGTYFEEQLI